ncbi:MAG TPA: DUF6134 family protein [Alphaproteobacteria bacterium]|nr:DUF6134 family protein [Alphaproteobacteria bacterium]
MEGRRSRGGPPTRRRLLIGGFACIGAGAAGLPAILRDVQAQPAPDLRYRVFRERSEIGAHDIFMRGAPDSRTVETKIRLEVKIAFITAFRYLHESTEAWRDGKLQSLVSRTDDNGEKRELVGASVGDGVRIVGPMGPFVARSHLMTSNGFWSAEFVRQTSLINAAEGGEVGISAKRLGEEEIPTRRGPVRAEKHRFLTPQCAGLVWYDMDGLLVRGIFEVKGETLIYEAA